MTTSPIHPRRPPAAALRAAVGLILAAAGLGACSDAVLPVVTTWEADLTPVGPGRRVTANVGVLSQAGRARTSIQLAGGEAGRTYRWRILTGACTGQGEVVGGTAVYPELTPGAQGTASGETTLSRELDPEGSYAAWLFLAAGADDVVVACGEMVRGR